MTWFKREPYSAKGNYRNKKGEPATPLWHLYEEQGRDREDPEAWPWVKAACGYVHIYPRYLNLDEAVQLRESVKTAKIRCAKCWAKYQKMVEAS